MTKLGDWIPRGKEMTPEEKDKCIFDEKELLNRKRKVI